jgi:predicted dinucleotide-binding enzyme
MRLVMELIDELDFAAIDTGSLADGVRRQQPGSTVYAADVTGAQAREAVSF